MLTPCSTARRTVRCMISGSPAWKPQARLAWSISGMAWTSSPIFQAPKLSPMSQLRRIRVVMPGSLKLEARSGKQNGVRDGPGVAGMARSYR
ncbi:hypothetical protein D3C78_1543820 [compost metagenome]